MATHTVAGVEENSVSKFVTEYLSGKLGVPRKSKSKTPGNLLVFHMPKTHTDEKYASGRFEKTYSGGSLKYYVKTKKLVLQEGSRDMADAIKFRDRLRSGWQQDDLNRNDVANENLVWNMRGLWENFCEDPTPKWVAVQANPRAFDAGVINSGKHQGKTFKQCYGVRKVSKYAEWLMRGDAELDSSRGKTSLGMRMFYEYCLARSAMADRDVGVPSTKRPAASARGSSVRPSKRSREAMPKLRDGGIASS